MFKGLTNHLKEKNVHSLNVVPSNNIELFDCYTGLILGNLYRNFPLPVTVTAENFIDYKGAGAGNRATVEKEEDLFMGTLKWLADVGYIHFDGMSGVSFFEVVLTNPGLLILRAFPEGTDTAQTIGEKLSHCSNSENEAELRELVTEALNLGSRMIRPMTRSGI